MITQTAHTDPWRNPALAAELSWRERKALMSADDYDRLLDRVFSQHEPSIDLATRCALSEHLLRPL